MLSLAQKQSLFLHLRQFVEPRRAEKFEEIAQYRTRHLTIVLENIFQSQNASAILRSCECMGVQDVHILENVHKFETHPDIALGANKWLNIFQYANNEENTTQKVIQNLRHQGYKIVATTPHKNDFSPERLPLENKIALFFGTELTGVSEDVSKEADYFLRIPMYGFTESYNVSVSVALAMYELAQRIRQSPVNWQLSEEERLDVLLEWLTRSIRLSEKIVAEWQKKIRL